MWDFLFVCFVLMSVFHVGLETTFISLVYAVSEVYQLVKLYIELFYY